MQYAYQATIEANFWEQVDFAETGRVSILLCDLKTSTAVFI